MYLIADIEGKRQAQESSPPAAEDRLEISRLEKGQEEEALEFLSLRPLYTFALTGFIRENGIESLRNRGRFYACRNAQGKLEGLALVGHAVMFEAESETAIKAFARLTRAHREPYLVLGERDRVRRFCEHYSKLGRVPRLMNREALFQLSWPVGVFEDVPSLRLATFKEFDSVVQAHARMGIEERGVNPLEIDPAGFVERCCWRVENNRTWVWIENGRLLFKAEVMFDTPEMVYLEGVWVPPEERSKGYGVRCLSQLSRNLLRQTESLCLLANDYSEDLHAFYRKVGFKQVGCYQTLYL